MATNKTPTTEAFSLLRFTMAAKFDWLSSLIFGFIPVEKPGLGTFATDHRMRWYYDPKMFEENTLEELVGAGVHECYHHLFEHFSRGKNLNAKKWNMAGDYEINDGLVRETKMPSWVIQAKAAGLPEDQIAEFYYSKIPDQPFGGNGPGGGGKGDKPKPGGGHCGSSACDQPAEWEDAYTEETEYKDGEGVDPVVQEYYRRQVAEDIINSKNRGSIPGGMQRWAEKKLKSKVDWKREVRANVQSAINSIAAGMVDYSRSRRNRRQESNPDFILPGFISPSPSVGIIADTSGSMSDAMVAQIKAEVAKVLTATSADVYLVDVDCEVNHVGRVKNPNDINLKGGGGTDMRLGYEALSKIKPRIHLVVCITDGYTPWPDSPIPGTKNIIVLTVKEKGDDAPKWAKVLHAVPEED
jgi:predicted metal-dependent peptidase